MKKLSILLFALLVAAVAPLTSNAQEKAASTTAAETKKLKDGDKCIDFSYTDIDGKTVTLADLKGKYVLIDVWATWCGPCVKEIPFLKKLEEKMHGKNITFVSISCDKDKSKWEEMVKAENLVGVQLHNGGDRTFMDAFGITGIPRFIMLDKKGKVIKTNMIRPSKEKEIYDFLMALKGI